LEFNPFSLAIGPFVVVFSPFGVLRSLAPF
jgi:hypothetical protein